MQKVSLSEFFDSDLISDNSLQTIIIIFQQSDEVEAEVFNYTSELTPEQQICHRCESAEALNYLSEPYNRTLCLTCFQIQAAIPETIDIITYTKEELEI